MMYEWEDRLLIFTLFEQIFLIILIKAGDNQPALIGGVLI
jgi:hypothetical protein